MSREPAAIQQEIEQTRAELASTLDRLAEKTSPKRLAAQGRAKTVAGITSPAGLSVIGAIAGLTVVLVVRMVRRHRR
jgi:hypothetical protein